MIRDRPYDRPYRAKINWRGILAWLFLFFVTLFLIYGVVWLFSGGKS